MSMSTPTPALFAGRRKPEPPKSDSSTPSSPEAETSAKTPEPASKKPFVRKPHLTQSLREDGVLKDIMAELRTSEEINRKHGWYDRNRNGKQRAPRKNTNKEKN